MQHTLMVAKDEKLPLCVLGKSCQDLMETILSEKSFQLLPIKVCHP